MAPITDDTVEVLRDTIRKLESRVHQLEAKMGGGAGSQSKSNLASVRMILMGPPGAGRKPPIERSSTIHGLQILQAKGPKHQRYRKSTVPVTWYNQFCSQLVSGQNLLTLGYRQRAICCDRR